MMSKVRKKMNNNIMMISRKMKMNSNSCSRKMIILKFSKIIITKRKFNMFMGS